MINHVMMIEMNNEREKMRKIKIIIYVNKSNDKIKSQIIVKYTFMRNPRAGN